MAIRFLCDFCAPNCFEKLTLTEEPLVVELPPIHNMSTTVRFLKKAFFISMSFSKATFNS